MSRQRRVSAHGIMPARACVMYRHICRFVHASCIVEANKHRTDKHDTCPTCKQHFVGALQMAAAKARVFTTRLDQNFDPAAVANLAGALLAQGKYDDALATWQDMLQVQVKILGLEHPDVADTKNKCTCFFFTKIFAAH